MNPGVLACRLRERARATNRRLTLLLAGSPEWTAASARQVLAALASSEELTAFWLGTRDLGCDERPPIAVPPSAGTQLLGSECDLLFCDAWSGFDPDGFGAACGTLRGGGLLLLLTPPLDLWPAMPDPQAERIAVWPHRAETVGRRFVARLVRVLEQSHDACPTLAENGVSPGMTEALAAATELGPVTARATPEPSRPATPDQAKAIDAVLRLAHGRARRPLVLTAHRGRGKSAALGIAAARLAADGPRRILVTAPRLDACEALFRHAAAVWPEAQRTAGTLAASGRSIEFRSPDAILDARPPADLLLVDEAAGIPAPLLGELLELYPRIVFATTVHGYEGTGRGFEVRFRATLDRRTPGWHALTLETPIRWAVDDPLESLVFRALLLDAAPAAAEGLAGASPQGCRFERLDRDALAAAEPTLAQVFGLLVLAHYQTRPLDLRMLLDGPNVRVYVLWHGDRVAGTLIAAEEGGMRDSALVQAIYDGTRRPRGHLLPQTLSAHAGLAEAPALRYLRVVRIAVHPAVARRGLGRLMLRRLYREARRDGLDLVGTSFGATPELIGFWSACGFRCAQVGTHRNAASGEHALAMLRPTSRAGWTLARRAESRLEARLGVLLPGPLRRLDPHVAAALAAAIQVTPPADEQAGADPEVRSFACHRRTLDAALPALSALVHRELGSALRERRLDLQEGALLVAAARQLRPSCELARGFGLRGHEHLIARLRALVARLIH